MLSRGQLCPINAKNFVHRFTGFRRRSVVSALRQGEEISEKTELMYLPLKGGGDSRQIARWTSPPPLTANPDSRNRDR